MGSPHSRTRWFVSLLAAWAASSAGAAVTVEVKPPPQQIYVNEPFELVVEVSHFETCRQPVFPQLPHCLVRHLDQKSQTTQTEITSNGRREMVQTRTFVYELVARRSGALQIPAIDVFVDGEARRTHPLQLDVQPDNTDELFIVEVSSGPRRIYVGQRVHLTLLVWVRPAVRGSQQLPSGTMLRQIQTHSFGPFPVAPPDSTSVRTRSIAGAEQMFYVYTWVAEFVATQPGPLQFGDIEVGIDYPTAGGTRKLRAQPELDLEVLPVPATNRPPAFNGAVGLFDIEVTARPTAVRVGDPIELTIDIFGDGPLASLPPPALTADPVLTRDFRLPTGPLTGEVIDARRRFQVTIRARHENVTAVPAIAYPYFDPDHERFVSAHSDPIPLSVAPVAQLTPLDSAPPSAARNDPQVRDGLCDIEIDPARLLARERIIAPGVVTVLLLAPPGAFLVAWLGMSIASRRTADPVQRRYQTAAQRARQRIARVRTADPRGMAAEVTAALAGYLADRLNEPRARCTAADALRLLLPRQAPRQLAELWSDVHERCDQITYGAARSSDLDELRRQALECVRTLEQVTS